MKGSELQKIEDGDTGKSIIFWDIHQPIEIEATASDIEYVVISGDRIDKLADRFLGSPLLWWVICQRNDIELPAVELYQGRKIIIPSKSAVDSALP